MPRLLVLFLDGVGLGDEDAVRNPFVSASMPALAALLEGRRLTRSASPFEGARATLLALDPCLGVDGAPQSASGQAAILTGRSGPRRDRQPLRAQPQPADCRHSARGQSLPPRPGARWHRRSPQCLPAPLFPCDPYPPAPLLGHPSCRLRGRAFPEDRRRPPEGRGAFGRFHRRGLGRTTRFPSRPRPPPCRCRPIPRPPLRWL